MNKRFRGYEEIQNEYNESLIGTGEYIENSVNTEIDNNNIDSDDNYFSKDKPLVSLLGVCNIMFKNNLINFNEKCQLKKLIIGKDEKIFDKIGENEFFGFYFHFVQL